MKAKYPEYGSGSGDGGRVTIDVSDAEADRAWGTLDDERAWE